MKGKVILLFLLFLVGMWMITSVDGWCKQHPPGWVPVDRVIGATPWDDDIANFSILPVNNPYIPDSIDGVAEDSAFNQYNLPREDIRLGKGKFKQ